MRVEGIASDGSGCPLTDRLALRPGEAARALGVSERTLRSMLPALPHFREGNVVLIPVDGLRDWLRERCKAEDSNPKNIADQIVRSLNE